MNATAADAAVAEPRDLPSVLLTVSFRGTHYAGFQRQGKGEDTVQARLEQAWQATTGLAGAAIPSGRTDAGVHAAAMPVQFRLPPARESDLADADRAGDVPLADLPRALNTRLPHDIVVRAARRMPPGFHARFDALGKTYVYNIWNDFTIPPFWQPWAHRWGPPLDLAAMRAAAAALSGTLDYRAFARSGRPIGDARRSVRLTLAARGPLVTLWSRGDGFLYKMVRALAGTLLDVGRGHLRAELLPDMLAGVRRSGPTAPACGLSLAEVRYEWGTIRDDAFLDMLPQASDRG